MSVQKKFSKVLQKSELQTMRHFIVRMKEEDNLVSGINTSLLDDSQLISAIIHYKKGNSQLNFGKFNGKFFNYSDFTSNEIITINVAFDQSDLLMPEAIIAIGDDPSGLLNFIALNSNSPNAFDEKCIVYWESREFAQLMLYGYDYITKTMQCKIQSARPFLLKQFLRQVAWNMLPEDIISNACQQDTSNDEEYPNES